MEHDTDRGSLKRIYSAEGSTVSNQSLIESYYKLKKRASGRTLPDTPVAKQSGELYVQNIPESKLLSIPHDSEIKQGNNESQTSSNNCLSLDSIVHGNQDFHIQQGSVSSKVTHTNCNFFRINNDRQICGSLQENERAKFSVTNDVHKQQQLFSTPSDNNEASHIRRETEEEEIARNKCPSHAKFHGMSHGVGDVNKQQEDIISEGHYTPDVSLWQNEKANLAGDRSVKDSTPGVASQSVPRPFFPWGESGQGQILPKERLAYNTDKAAEGYSSKYSTYQSMTIENRNSKEHLNPGYAALPFQTYSTTNADSHTTLTNLIGKSVSDLLPCHQMKRDCEKLFSSEPDVTSTESNSGQTCHAHINQTPAVDLLESHLVKTDSEKLFLSEPDVTSTESNSGQTRHAHINLTPAVDLLESHLVKTDCERLFPSKPDVASAESNSGLTCHAHINQTPAVDLLESHLVKTDREKLFPSEPDVTSAESSSGQTHRAHVDRIPAVDLLEYPDIGQDNTGSVGSPFHLDIKNSLLRHRQIFSAHMKAGVCEDPGNSLLTHRQTLTMPIKTEVPEHAYYSSLGQKHNLNVHMNTEGPERINNSSLGQKSTGNIPVKSEHAKIIGHSPFSVGGPHLDNSNVKQEIQQRDITLKEMCMKSQRGIFQFVPKSVPLSIADTHILIEKSQCEELGEITVPNKINYVYNPLEYAFETHYNFIQKFCNTEKKILFLGMNPGPWGMSQNGVPFGESSLVRDWLKISGSILKPEPEHPKRLVTGLDCTRSEVSGSRFWGFFRSICNTPETFFTNCFVYNMCPLAFMSDTGKNITPPQMESEFRNKINSVCDKALLKILIVFNVSTIVGVGKFACERAKSVLSKAGIEGVRVEYIMHPSPLNPAANKGWNNIATEQLQNLQLLDIVTNSC